uniref:Prolyl 4-hydroxylase alpha subunit domain-containing protein n=1 Tax=Alexandrium catenella TaxID=2925 RepID=A0A7S1WH38_ALECA|mmetsp:Transcript_60749/g.162603  ORF Transcript_60749/g.162603 Transcript_60749/m.162603 type:complete len:284 (+) Transcript_60749:106-957(+)
MAGDISAGLSNISSLSTADTMCIGVPAERRTHVLPLKVGQGVDGIRLDFEVKFPKERPKPPTPQKTVEKITQTSALSLVFAGPRRFPESVYFREVDCVGLTRFLSGYECAQIIDFAEGQGFSRQHRHNQLQLYWQDILDPCLCQGIWSVCGLGEFLGSVKIDGMVPCGLNDVVRIQKFMPGDLSGRHTDQPVRRKDGRVSKYSLRVFLNGMGEGSFEGGLSAFHASSRRHPVLFEPEVGLALLYPQGDGCAVQEETQVLRGCKYVLRADVLFCKPEDHHKYSC